MDARACSKTKFVPGHACFCLRLQGMSRLKLMSIGTHTPRCRK